MSQLKSASLFDTRILVPAIGGAFRKLNPKSLIKNPVMFVVAVVSAFTTVLFVKDLVTGSGNLGFSFQINLWLWFTVLFANFAEAVAEGRGKAQADSLRRARTETQAKLLPPEGRGSFRMVPGTSLKVGDTVLVEAGEQDVERDLVRRLLPLGGHRRHPGAQRLDPGAHHRGPGFDLPRPHDFAGRRRRAVAARLADDGS